MSHNNNTNIKGSYSLWSTKTIKYSLPRCFSCNWCSKIIIRANNLKMKVDLGAYKCGRCTLNLISVNHNLLLAWMRKLFSRLLFESIKWFAHIKEKGQYTEENAGHVFVFMSSPKTRCRTTQDVSKTNVNLTKSTDEARRRISESYD